MHCKTSTMHAEYGNMLWYQSWACERNNGRLGPKVLEWRPHRGERSVVWSPTRWTDDIKESLRSAGNKRPRIVDFGTTSNQLV
ncbi:jg27576 [Pararge aegeria aegeria]|uniref:Jg27576 protein n=1 Tax=Pararge aegeria aegeria TaxID=348720 RepID=A0A8S4SFM7_9NEOP|nr:jg27576 [Pararge aegeria aegeria]